MEKNECNWTPFNNNQEDLRNELNELKELSELGESNELASKNINAYEDCVYKESHFFGFIKRQEKIEKFKTQKLNKQPAMKNKDV